MRFAIAFLCVSALLQGSAVTSSQAQPAPDRFDTDQNGTVDFSDFLAFAEAFGTDNPDFDLDGNGEVDFPDFISFADVFSSNSTYQVLNLDSGLMAAIRVALGNPSGDILVSAASELTELTASKVVSLDGIKSLPALETFDVTGPFTPSPVKWDLAQLKQLDRLTQLSINFADIDLNELAPLGQLKSLSLKSAAYDFATLPNLPSLDSLFVSELSSGELAVLPTAAPNLRRLHLSRFKNLTTLDPLRELQLDKLIFSSGTQINNLDLLEGLPVTHLSLFREITAKDESDLSRMTALETLVLENSGLTKVDFLTTMTGLEELRVTNVCCSNRLNQAARSSFNRITDLRGLTNLERLRILDLTDNFELEDISSIATLGSLESLSIVGNRITDLSPLRSLSSLKTLRLGGNPVRNLAPLESLTNLTNLSIHPRSGYSQISLAQNEISDLSVLSSLLKLESFSGLLLHVDRLPDLSSLQKLKKMTLVAPLITDFEALRSANQITDLTLAAGAFDVSPIESFTSLEHLRLSGHGPLDLAKLSGMTELKSLSVENLVAPSLQPISAQTQLERLILRNNNLSDISAVSQMSRLTDVTIANNEVVDPSPFNTLPNLKRLDLSGNLIRSIDQVAENSSLVGTSVDLKDNPLAGGFHPARMEVNGITFTVGVRSDQTPQFVDSELEQAVHKAIGYERITRHSADEIFTLDLSGSDVRNLEGIRFLRGLKSLDLRGTLVEELNPLLYLRNLERLRLDDAMILKGFEPISRMTRLKSLSLDGIDVDPSHLASLAELDSLWIGNPSLSTIPPGNVLTHLKFLSITRIGELDLTNVEGHTALGHLELSGIAEGVVPDLGTLPSLRILKIRESGLEAFTSVGLDSLRVLDLSGNRISDLTFVNSLQVITRVDLSGNGITDLTPLLGLGVPIRKQGNQLILDGNPLDLSTASLVIERLRSSGVSVSADRIGQDNRSL